MKKRNGFTLVEVMVAMVIIAILAVMMIGIFNTIKINNRARDTQRKKDLNRIKVAFEEYYSDRGYYPVDVTTWNTSSNCSSGTIFSPYLNPWPCDPKGTPYIILMINSSTFKILTNLETHSDTSIPKFWYERGDLTVEGYTKDQVNYGVSSSNILWYDVVPNANCDTTVCLSSAQGGCDIVSNGCFGSYCYYYDYSNANSCTSQCKAACCGKGCE